MPLYDAETEAKACVNELFYRGGPEPKDITRRDAECVAEKIKEYLKEAYGAGLQQS